VQGLRCRAEAMITMQDLVFSSGLRVEEYWFRVYGVEFTSHTGLGLQLRVYGFKLQDSKFRVQG